MNNKYRIAIRDSVNGEFFTYAMVYTTSGKEAASHSAIKEFGRDINIVEVRRLVN